MFPGVINSIIEQPTSLILKSTNDTWNLHYFDPYKKNIELLKDVIYTLIFIIIPRGNYLIQEK